MHGVLAAFVVVAPVWLVAPLREGLRAFAAARPPGHTLPSLLMGASVLVIALAPPVGFWRARRSPAEADALRVGLGVSLGLLAGWTLLNGIRLVSRGFALSEPAVVGGTLGLGLGLAGGLFFGSPPPRGAVRWVRRFAAGLALAAGLAFGTSWLVLFVAMSTSLMRFDAAASASAPLLWGTGWLVAELCVWRGRTTLGLGVGVGALGLGVVALSAT